MDASCTFLRKAFCTFVSREVFGSLSQSRVCRWGRVGSHEFRDGPGVVSCLHRDSESW